MSSAGWLEEDGQELTKKRRRVEIKVLPLPAPYTTEQAICPMCGRMAGAMGRLAMQIVFRCTSCRVVFKRSHATPLGY